MCPLPAPAGALATRMQARRGGLAPWLRAAAVLLAALLAAPGLARACEGSGPGAAHGAARWDRQLLVKGRQRSLLSMQGRRWGPLGESPGPRQRQGAPPQRVRLHSPLHHSACACTAR
jgi:hypothetical protein